MGETHSKPTEHHTSTKKVNLVSVNPNLDENRKLHNTKKYKEKASLITRRGTPFSVTITFDTHYELPKEELKISLELSPEGTNHILACPSSPEPPKVGSWGVYVESIEGNNANCQVHFPPDAPIGQYSVTVNIRGKGIHDTVNKLNAPVIVLFNPWNPLDSVYMENEAERQEYVLQEDGLIFVGSANNNSGKPWLFGQFEKVSLEVALLAISSIPFGNRFDPVLISRQISSYVNRCGEGDDGILIGNWSGNYDGGEAPTSWTGSVAILEKYKQSGYRSVKYGQCWVFSGVTTTICRAIGLPCRSVTNFSSAHDTNGNRIVDRYLDDNGNIDESKTDDSIWNFHVWNDVWMQRPDLPRGRDGWNAIDATPQEVSGGKYQMGPSSLVAVKNGEKANYDNEFVIAEVNADIRYWKKVNGKYKLTNVDTDAVGLKMLTKKVGSYEPWNIIDQYKFPEGDVKERASLLSLEEGDCTFRWVLEKAQVGEDLVAVVEVNTTSSQGRTVRGHLVGHSTNYRGNKKEALKNVDFEEKVPCSLRITLTPQEYGNALSDSSYPFQFEIFANVVETDQNQFSFKQVVLGSPEIQVIIPDQVKKGEASTAQIKFINPLDKELTGVSLHVDGANLIKSQQIQCDNITANDTFFASIDFQASRKGTYLLHCSIESKELSIVTGFATVVVK